MRYKKTFLLISLTFLSCSKPIIFVLKDSEESSKYSLSDSVKIAFRNDLVNKTPLVAIDGIILEYDKKSDTIQLPLKKSDIQAMQIVGRNASLAIYGSQAEDGAIIINTVNLK